MKILHYTIGFAPERTGGLVTYAKDLMLEQIHQNHEVFTLYPTTISSLNKKVKIKKGEDREGIKTYQLINSLPLPFIRGIRQPSDFMVKADESVYKVFLKDLSPDVVHVHSLMGLHKEFFKMARQLGIKVVFTSHDYFGLSPVPEFYFGGHSYDMENTNETWNIMSSLALPTKSLRLFQLPFFPLIRNFKNKISRLRNQDHSHNDKQLDFGEKLVNVNYNELRTYYQSIFKMIDSFHFNSHIAQQVYKNNLCFSPKGKVVSITHAGVKQHNLSQNTSDKLRVAYIGPDKDFKGFFDFINFAENCTDDKLEFHTYGYPPRDELSDKIQQHGRFSYMQVDDVYKNIDAIVVPSKWKETFGFIVIEAISYGKMVFTSETVGSKDLLPKNQVFTDLSEISMLLKDIDFSQTKVNVKKIDEHTKEMIEFYKEVVKG
ncbi:glycosyltransferase [Streptococcus hyointestinalis]|uniref:glycosyltransferase n=1 Tax=Streptococcus hyointestinalis TaxID=1337 RepID=UPI003CFEBCF2